MKSYLIENKKEYLIIENRNNIFILKDDKNNYLVDTPKDIQNNNLKDLQKFNSLPLAVNYIDLLNQDKNNEETEEDENEL